MMKHLPTIAHLKRALSSFILLVFWAVAQLFSPNLFAAIPNGQLLVNIYDNSDTGTVTNPQPGQWYDYSYSFTAPASATTISVLERNDCGAFVFEKISVKAQGSSTELLTNSDFLDTNFTSGTINNNAVPRGWSKGGTSGWNGTITVFSQSQLSTIWGVTSGQAQQLGISVNGQFAGVVQTIPTNSGGTYTLSFRMYYQDNVGCGWASMPSATALDNTDAGTYAQLLIYAGNPPNGYVGAPSAITSAASSVTSSGATLNATVADNGANTTVSFEWDTTSRAGGGSYAHATVYPDVAGNITANGALASASGVSSAAKVLTGLSGATPYYYRAIATNSEGTAYGSEQSFTTTAANAAPSAGIPSITGTVQVGQTLTGSYTYSDAESNGQDTSGSGTSYRWVRADASNMTGSPTNVATGFTGGNDQTYTVVAGDASKYLFYCVTPKASAGTLTGNEACSSATAQVPAQVNGACDATNHGQTLTSAPSSNLCTAGSASGVTSGNSNYTWTCTGSGGGTTANCSATRNYVVTTSAGANGSISASQNVAYNATPSFTVTPSGGYYASMGGTCGGSLSGNTYTTGAITANCTVIASFVANAAPTVSVGPSISGTVLIGQLLSGSYTYNDAESDSESGTTYRWVRSTDNSVATTGDNADVGTSTSYTLQSADAGKYLFYCVTPKASAGASPGSEACSSATVQVPTPASVSSVSVPSNGSYRAGQTLDFTLTFSGNVTVTGTPRITLTVGSSTVYATYVSGSGTSALLFRYTVQPGDTDADGIAAATPIDLNSGTIVDALSQNATLTWTVPSLAGVKVDTTAPTAPSVVGPANGYYKAGQNLDFTITYGEAVTVTNTPRLTLTIGSTTRYADYLSGSGTTALTFRHTVQSGDNDSDGIVATSPVDLNTTGTIKDAAGNNATLTYTSPDLSSVFVDTSAPDKHGTTSIAASDVDTSVSYTASDTITITFNEPVATASVILGNITVSGGHTLGTGAALSPLSASGGHASSYRITLGTSPTMAVGDTLTIAAADVVDRATNQAASSVVFTLPNFNALPTASAVSASLPGGTAAVAAGVTLTGSYTYGDTDSDAEQGTTFQWYTATAANCTTGQSAIGGATGSTYTVLSSQEGKYLCFGVTPAAASGNSPGLEVLAASLLFANAAPILSGSTPADAGTGVALTTALSLSFNEGVSAVANIGGAPAFWLCDAPQGGGPYNLASCPAIATFESAGNSNNDAAPAGTASISSNVVTLTLPGAVALANSKQYYLFASNAAVKDAVNNNFAGVQIAFTTVAPTPSGGGEPSNTTTLPTGGSSASPTAGQTVIVTNNGNNGSTINLPTPPSSSGGATVTVSLPGTGNIAVSNNTAGTQLQVQNITLPGSSTPVSTVQVSNGSATLVASGAGQTLVTTGLTNGLTLTSGASGTSATVTASGNNQTIALTGNANLTLGSNLDTQRTSVILNQAGSGGTPTQANLNIGGQTLSVSPSSSSATVQVVPTTIANGQTTSTLVVTSGSANIVGQSSGQILNAIPASSGNCPAGTTGGYFEARSNNAQSNVLSVNQGSLALTGHVPQGVVAYHYTSAGSCNGFALSTPLDSGNAKEILIYQGEYVEIDKNGQPVKIIVRSQDGKGGAAGDPLTVSSSGLTVNTIIPRISQSGSLNSGRLPAGQSIAQSIESLLKLYNASWTVSSQDSFGALRLSNSSGEHYTVLPVGQVLADAERPDGFQCYGNGLCQITARNLSTRFNAALDAPQAFIAELRKIDPAATVSLNPDGNLQVSLNGRTYLAQVSWQLSPSNGNGFSSDKRGLGFSSSSGSQTLYPVLANLDRLQTILKQIDASATALGDHQGGFTVQSQGQLYRLTPAWELITTPAAHANDDYWLDNGAIYINYLNGTAQGVSVK